MRIVNVHDAKTNFSRLVDAAASGEEIVIAKAGTPTARLVALKPAAPERKFGVLRGRIEMAQDFDAPLSDEVLAEFEGDK